MKKIILKSLTCILVLGMAWSCSTENDVQIDSSAVNGSTHLKDGSVMNGVIGVDLGNGVYQIIVDRSELLAEIARISAEDGNPVIFETVDIVKKVAVNNPSLEGFVLLAGTGTKETSSATTMAFTLTMNGANFSIGDPFGTGNGSGGPIIEKVSCRGCGTGCFLEFYEIDGHFMGYCDTAGCGAFCQRIKR